MILIMVLAVVLFLSAGIAHGRKKVSDTQYMNEDGDHIYYDRASIEKKEFVRRHPDVKGVRTLGRLFRRK